GVRHWSALVGAEELGRRFRWVEPRGPQGLAATVVALNYSSGTTGVPKGVMISHANYVANCVQTAWLARRDPGFEERRARARYLCFLPMYHAMAQTMFCVSAPRDGVPVYLMPRFDFLGMLEAVERFRITDLILVPPIVVAMAKHPAAKKADLSSVERVGSGAAPLGREVCAELEKLWPEGKINVKQGWGMTEATCTVTTWPPNSISHSFSVGELAPNCEAKIVEDEAGQHEVKQGERGELWVRAPNVMMGYWGKPEATRETLTEDGWLRTGDIAYMDEENRLFIVDRKKARMSENELIKVKGLQVAPAELEALLLDHPAVADAAVIGVTIKGEEAPRAYIVLNQGQKATAEDINAFMETRISKSKRLTGGIRFIDAIPKNPSGKILRKILRDQAKADVGDSDARESRL
ncbi:acetyl-CoA synthetase-like protein, partial [Glonium stellatum]